MVGAMARLIEPVDSDNRVVEAKTDPQALGDLYDRYYGPVLRFCVHRLFDKTDAEDVVSVVFLAVAEGIRSFPGRTEQDFRNWVYAIAANHCNAHIRKVSTRRRLLARAAQARTDALGDEPTGDYPDWPELYQAIRRLKPRHQTIVTLRFFEGLRYDEIAAITGTTPQAARVALHRALKKLRKLLNVTRASCPRKKEAWPSQPCNHHEPE